MSRTKTKETEVTVTESNLDTKDLNWFDRFIFEMKQLAPENRKIKRVINMFDKYEKKGRKNLTEEELDKLEDSIASITLTKKEEFILFKFYEPKVKGLNDISEITEFVHHNFNKKLKVYRNKERELGSELGPYLKQLRKEQGLTLADVQRLSESNISVSYISRIENTSRPSPSLALLKDLASIYKRPCSEVLKVAGMELEEEEKKPSVIELNDLLADHSIKINGVRVNKEKKKMLVEAIYNLFDPQTKEFKM